MLKITCTLHRDTSVPAGRFHWDDDPGIDIGGHRSDWGRGQSGVVRRSGDNGGGRERRRRQNGATVCGWSRNRRWIDDRRCGGRRGELNGGSWSGGTFNVVRRQDRRMLGNVWAATVFHAAQLYVGHTQGAIFTVVAQQLTVGCYSKRMFYCFSRKPAVF